MRAGVLILSILCLASSPAGADVKQAIETIRAVDHRGAGAEAAQQAYRDLLKSGKSQLEQILHGLDGANPLAENYLRSAFEVIADSGAGDAPEGDILAFLKDKSHSPRARALAFEWYAREKPQQADKLLADMLLDPSSEIRRKAVQKRIDAAKAAKGDAAVAEWKAAMSGAVDEDQVKQIAAALKKAGREVDLISHFGLLTSWRIIGPFDNRGKKGFNVAYPPEKELDFDATYQGMNGKVRWQTIQTPDRFGKIDIAAQIAPYKGAVMYMYSEFDADKAGDVWFRLATPNAWKLWVNGELVFAREEYHRGMRWDQYRVKAALKQGKNKLLFKILQNEQTEDWAQDYAVQFRVCNREGVAILPAEPFQASTESRPSPLTRR